jgi:hypothetical protein
MHRKVPYVEEDSNINIAPLYWGGINICVKNCQRDAWIKWRWSPVVPAQENVLIFVVVVVGVVHKEEILGMQWCI